MNVVHLELIVVCDNIEYHVKVFKNFKRYHFESEAFIDHTLFKVFDISKKTHQSSTP